MSSPEFTPSFLRGDPYTYEIARPSRRSFRPNCWREGSPESAAVQREARLRESSTGAVLCDAIAEATNGLQSVARILQPEHLGEQLGEAPVRDVVAWLEALKGRYAQ